MSGWYHKTVQGTFLATAGAAVDLDTDTIKVVMVSATYTYSDTHQFYSDLTGIVPAGQAYNGNTALTGVTMDATAAMSATSPTNITLSEATSVTGLVIYKQGAAATSSPLIVYINAGTGLPFTPNGNVNITWDTGANKIAKL